MTTIKIILSILLLIAMMFLVNENGKPDKSDLIECKENLKDISDELCGLEYDIYKQEDIADEIRKELTK